MTALLPIRLWKEVRELGPAWLIAVAVVTVARVAGDIEEDFGGLAMLAYAVGALALGALSMGHEYSNGTLAQLLAQPGRRWAALARKFAALAALLLALTAIAWLALSNIPPRFLPAPLDFGLGLPLLCGLFLVPCLTLVTRNSLAGIVFTVGVIAMLLLTSDLVARLRYGELLWTTLHANAQALRLELLWPGLLLASAAAAAVTAWKFLRLEVVDGRGVELHLSARVFPTADGRSRDAVDHRALQAWRLLAAKELRLQQLTYVVAGLFLVGWLTVAHLPEHLAPSQRDDLLRSCTILHAYAIAFMVGSLASAEERQLGTLSSQMLLPVAAWRQWLLKSVVVMAVSLGLAFGLPAFAYGLGNATGAVQSAPPLGGVWSLAVPAITVLSLYVSSLSSNGLRALVAALAVTAVLLFVAAVALELLVPGIPYFWRQEPWMLRVALPTLGAVATAVALLWLGMRNHRSAERSATLARRQVAWITAVVALSIGALAPYHAVRSGQARRASEQAIREYEERYARLDFEIDAEDTVARDAVVVLFYSSEDGVDRYSFTWSRSGAPRYIGVANRSIAATAVWQEGTTAAELHRRLRTDAVLRESLRSSAVVLVPPSRVTTNVSLAPVQLQ